YKKLKGDLETVKNTIKTPTRHCHVEVTILIVPGENDCEEEMEELSDWLCGISNSFPLHISQFFLRGTMQDGEATPVETVYRLANIARKRLRNVYEGNC